MISTQNDKPKEKLVYTRLRLGTRASHRSVASRTPVDSVVATFVHASRPGGARFCVVFADAERDETNRDMRTRSRPGRASTNISRSYNLHIHMR